MTIEVGILIAIASLALGYFTFSMNRNKELKADGQQSAEFKAGLDYIRKGVDDIRIDIKATEKQVNILNERVTRVEESSKQSHKRIDNIEKELDKV